MAFCPKCGSFMENDAKFCPSCGTNMQEAENATPVAEPVILEVKPKERSLNVGMLVWSIINVALCSMPLGVAALVTTITAKSADDDVTEQKRLRSARICNIIGTVLGAVIFVISFISGFMEALA